MAGPTRRHRPDDADRTDPMNPEALLVPVRLRPLVLIARMAALSEVTPPADIERMLTVFTPPIDPASPEWAALRAALDRYDTTQNQAGRDAARTQINIAAVALLAGPAGRGGARTPAWYRVPAQRTPGTARDH